MKEVMISIQPKYVELIAKGEKTIEVRKTRPKLETPFKVYIYCTKDNKTAFNNHNGNMFLSPKGWQVFSECNGKVIGEFVCDSVYEWKYSQLQGLNGTINTYFPIFVEDLLKTCLTHKDLENYGKRKPLYGWHISNLKIYDEPKELSEFKVECPIKNQINGDCNFCKYLNFSHYNHKPTCNAYLTRPPQSWCYVEVE